MTINPTRSTAAALLTAVLERHRPLEEALDALPPLEPRDRAAAHRLASHVLRRLGTIDALLEPWLRREPPAPARLALRIGTADLLLLGTPPHA
ncbi:transcription antitermination factor NusB, partial [Roseomonas sp. TAS13]